MKRKLSEHLSEISEEELSVLLNGMSFENTKDAHPIAVRKRIRFKKLIACALSLILIVALSVSGAVYAAERKEYKDAIEFLNENGFVYDELTRSQIKKVYKDIKSKSFSYDKTAELILERVDEYKVEGLEIKEGEIDPEKLEELWEEFLSAKYIKGDIGKDVSYSLFTDNLYNQDTGKVDPFTHSTVEKFVDGEKVFSIEFSKFKVTSRYSITQSGVIVEGRDVDYSTTQGSYWVAFINNRGEYVWDMRFDDIADDKYLWCDTALENDDGSFVLFVRMKNEISAMLVSSGGELLDEKTFEANVARKVQPYENGYIVWASSDLTQQKLIILDSQRRFISLHEYGEYVYTDMVYYNGRIYISATEEINPIETFEYAAETFKDENGEYLPQGTDDTLLKLYREGNTAYLLVLDTDNMVPEKYYCVKGAYSDKFNFSDDGELVWEANKIVSVFFSPYTSSFCFGGEAAVYGYVLDGSGKMINKYDTLEIIRFQR